MSKTPSSTKHAVSHTVYMTKDYSLFVKDPHNRNVNLKSHRKLYQSMQRRGFIPSEAIVVRENGDGKFVVKRGQHRLATAELLGLPVYYQIDNTDVDAVDIQDGTVKWTYEDFADNWITRGVSSYSEVVEFSEKYDIALATSAALLMGTTTGSNVKERFKKGAFEVREREFAETVAHIYSLFKINGKLSGSALLNAIIAVCRVPHFVPSRLIEGMSRSAELLKKYSTRDGFLEMFETIYNYRRSKPVGLKFDAIQAMKERMLIKPTDKLAKSKDPQ